MSLETKLGAVNDSVDKLSVMMNNLEEILKKEAQKLYDEKQKVKELTKENQALKESIVSIRIKVEEAYERCI